MSGNAPMPDESDRNRADKAQDEGQKHRNEPEGKKQPSKRPPDRRPTAGLELDTDNDREGIPQEPEF